MEIKNYWKQQYLRQPCLYPRLHPFLPRNIFGSVDPTRSFCTMNSGLKKINLKTTTTTTTKHVKHTLIKHISIDTNFLKKMIHIY